MVLFWNNKCKIFSLAGKGWWWLWRWWWSRGWRRWWGRRI